MHGRRDTTRKKQADCHPVDRIMHKQSKRTMYIIIIIYSRTYKGACVKTIPYTCVDWTTSPQVMLIIYSCILLKICNKTEIVILLIDLHWHRL